MNEINYINQTKQEISTFKSKFEEIFIETKKILKIKNIQLIDFFIVTKKQVVTINKKFRNKDYVADVISIEYNDINLLLPINFLGSIYICYDKAVEQAKEYGHSLEREICFLFVHGLLHIYGFDHIKSSEEKIMVDLEDKILNKVKIYR